MKRSVIFLIFILAATAASLLVISLKSTQKITPHPVLVTPTPIGISPDYTLRDKQNEKLLRAIENRPTISEADTHAKKQLLASLPKDTETIYKTDAFRVDYIRTPDVFQVEIASTGAVEAKKGAMEWFLSQGFTREGLCSLPIMFYLNFETKQKLPDLGASFTPLAEGC